MDSPVSAACVYACEYLQSREVLNSASIAEEPDVPQSQRVSGDDLGTSRPTENEVVVVGRGTDQTAVET